MPTEKTESFEFDGLSDDDRQWRIKITRRWNEHGHELRPNVQIATETGLSACSHEKKGVYKLLFDAATGQQDIIIRSNHPNAV